MAQTTGTATYWNSPNYDGLLFTADQVPGQGTGTPFLTLMGGMNGAKARDLPDFDFSMSAEYDFPAASQPAITETDSKTAPSAKSPILAANLNTVQIFQEAVDVTYKKISTTERRATDVVTGGVGYWAQQGESNQQDIVDENIAYVLTKVARDANYTFLNGSYVRATDSATAAKSRGIITGVSSSAVAAAAATLSKSMMNQLFRSCAQNSGGRTFQQMPIIFVNAFQKQMISTLYGYAEESWNIGGVDIQTIITDFGRVGVVYEPMVPASSLLLAALSMCRPAWVPVPGKGRLYYEELAKTGAAEKGQVYGQLGLDYANEKMHGKITGLATS